MTTALTAACPTCGSTQGKVCRDGRTPTTPHPARRNALQSLRTNGGSVFMVIRDVGQYRRGDLITGTPPRAGSNGVTVRRHLGGTRTDSALLAASAVVWVGWEDEFTPTLFNLTEALEAFPE